MSLAELRKKQEKSKLLLQEEMKKTDASKDLKKDDDRFWLPTIGADGNGSAVIRFLPAHKNEDIPWVRYWSHSFKNPDTGKWYIENSRSTLGEKDPLGELNSILWNKGEEGKEQARHQKRTENYVSNILVVKDPGNPENNGKVFLYRYGKKIFEKIKNIMTPDDDLGEEGKDPFCPDSGMNFVLKIKKVGDYRNYDDSKFNESSKIGNDNLIESVWSQVHPLKTFVDPSNFKSYDELKKRLDEVLGSSENEPTQKTVPKSEPKINKKPNNDAQDTDLDMDDIDALMRDMDIDT